MRPSRSSSVAAKRRRWATARALRRFWIPAEPRPPQARCPEGFSKDCRTAAKRWLIGISTFNYETQLAPSYAFAVYPLLRKMYPDDEDFKASLLNAMRYYNTMPWISPFVMGAALGIEDDGGVE